MSGSEIVTERERRDDGATRVGGSPRSRLPLVLVVAALILAADAISKAVVVATLEHHNPIHVIGSFLQLVVTRNPGAAFSFGPGLTIVFTAIAIGVTVVIVRTSGRIRSVPWAITLGLLLGGATGNLADRLLRSPGPFRGWVVDWIQLPHWPVFNLADSAIVCGGILSVLLVIRGIGIEGRSADPDKADGE